MGVREFTQRERERERERERLRLIDLKYSNYTSKILCRRRKRNGQTDGQMDKWLKDKIIFAQKVLKILCALGKYCKVLFFFSECQKEEGIKGGER